MRGTRGTRTRPVIVGLALGFLLIGVAEAKSKSARSAPPSFEPDPNHPAIKDVNRKKDAFIAQFFPRFLVGAGALISIGVMYSGIAWALRSPCRRCGSRKVQVYGRGKSASRRCNSCGAADSNR